MRYLVISDIHSNLAALQTVLSDADDFDEILCLGDLVGYGPNPNECVSRVREERNTCLAGNHDWAALGKLSLSSFNTDARIANAWTQRQLGSTARAFLNSLPTNRVVGDFTLAHASPREPVWEYITHATVARANLSHFSTPFCLVGHTHIPVIFRYDEDRDEMETVRPTYGEPFSLEPDRMIINPGSVGQPRDGNPEASYAILDADEMTWTYYRVEYPVEITQERMRAKDLPQRLVERLAAGR